MKLPKQVQTVQQSAVPAIVVEQGVTPSFLGAALGALGALPAIVDTGVGLASSIGCPIACANNDRAAIRGLGCNC